MNRLDAIAQIRNEINDLASKRLALISELNQLEEAEAWDVSIFKLGDVITWKRGKYKGRIVGISPSYVPGGAMSVTAYSVKLILKSGEEGTKVLSAFPFSDKIERA